MVKERECFVLEMEEFDLQDYAVAQKEITGSLEDQKPFYSFSEDEPNPVKLFLQEAGELPLLTRQQEQELAKRIQIGKAALKKLIPFYVFDGELSFPPQEVERLKRAVEKGQQIFFSNGHKNQPDQKEGGTPKQRELSEEERSAALLFLENPEEQLSTLQEHIATVEDGLEAFDRFERSNLKLLVSRAKHFQKRHKSPVLSILDLCQEGSFGLRRAAQDFDPEKGCKFSTYGIHWIDQTMDRALMDKSRTIRLPAHINEKLRQIKQVSQTLLLELGREPNIKEISQALQARGQNLTPEKIEEILSRSRRPISLDKHISEESEETLVDFLPSTCEEADIEEWTQKQALKDQLIPILGEFLTPRELKILIVRYGLEDGKSKTLEETGREFNVTRERIRQIEKKAFGKLRRQKNVRKLRDLL